MLKKGKNLFCAFLALLLFALVPVHVAKAEEIGELENGRIIKRFRWIHTNSIGNVVTYVSGDLLGSANVAYKNQLSTAASNWTNNKTLAACFVKSFEECNVALSSTTEWYWKEIGGRYSHIAITVTTDTSGLQITTKQDMENSNGRIKYAGIYFNPSPDPAVTGNSTYTLQVVMHEIGHVYGMGHVDPSKAYSIMQPGPEGGPTQLTTKDVSVMDFFYRR